MTPEERFADSQRLVSAYIGRNVKSLHALATIEDARQVCSLALWQAAQSYDEARGVPWGSHAWMKMHAAWIDYLRVVTGWRRLQKLPEHQRPSHNSLEVLAEAGWELAEPDAEPEWKVDWPAVFAVLPEREALIIRRYFLEGARFHTIADEMGISEPRVVQLKAQALVRLRKLTPRERGALFAA